jgi:2-Cys peroxiredoxin 5
MGAWGEAHGAEGKVLMLADTRAELTKALGIELDATGMLGNVRCRR